MKRFRIDQFRRIALAGDRAYIGFTNSEPAPFPGRWPTRIAWRVLTMDEDRSYIGKPAQPEVLAFRRLVGQHNHVEAWLMEFDRKHNPIYIWINAGPRSGTYMNQALYYVYHLWSGLDVEAGHLSGTLRLHKLDGVGVYAPYAALTSNRREEWRNYMRSLKPRIQTGSTL